MHVVSTGDAKSAADGSLSMIGEVTLIDGLLMFTDVCGRRTPSVLFGLISVVVVVDTRGGYSCGR